MLIGEHQTQVAFYTLMLSYCPNLKASSYKHFVKLHVLRADVSLVKSDTYNYIPGLLVGRGKNSNFAGFSESNSGKKHPILWEFWGKILLTNVWFSTDLTKVFNENRPQF